MVHKINEKSIEINYNIEYFDFWNEDNVKSVSLFWKTQRGSSSVLNYNLCQQAIFDCSVVPFIAAMSI
jgi:hypothetical protein